MNGDITDIVKEKGMTIRRLAKLTDRNKETINAYIKDVNKMRLGDYIKFCEVLNEDPPELLRKIIAQTEMVNLRRATGDPQEDSNNKNGKC